MAYMRGVNQSGLFLTMGDLIGDSIRTPQGEKIGQVEEIIFDADSGKAGFVIVSFIGKLALGDRLFVIPWQHLQREAINRCFLIDISKEKLALAPGFHKDSWPDMSDPTWKNDVISFYQDAFQDAPSVANLALPV